MKKKTILIRALILMGTLLIVSLAHGWGKKTTPSKGDNKLMKTHYVGRFSIAVPAEMHEAHGSRSHEIRREEITEIVWPERISHEKARESEWNKLMAEIKKLTPPKGKDKVIIRMRDFPDVGKWAKSSFYHASRSSRTATWAFLMDKGPVGVWIKNNPPVLVEAENKSNNTINNTINIAKSYRVMDPNTPEPKGDWFYLKYGAINLPYLWQEETDVRFEGHPLKLTLRIKMNMDGSYGIENQGLIEKSNALIDSGYAAMAQAKIKRIRSQKREVAGMPGEEVVDRLITKDKTELDFGWEYIGKEDSGEYPTIRITMESPDGSLDEKLKIWDAVLDSMKPMFERKK
jgi:hypothetical protein